MRLTDAVKISDAYANMENWRRMQQSVAASTRRDKHEIFVAIGVRYDLARRYLADALAEFRKHEEEEEWGQCHG